MDLNIAICEDEWTEYQALRHLLDECGQKAEPDYFGEGSALLNSFYPGKYDLQGRRYIPALLPCSACHGGPKDSRYSGSQT